MVRSYHCLRQFQWVEDGRISGGGVHPKSDYSGFNEKPTPFYIIESKKGA
jgi:hypothetical protein